MISILLDTHIWVWFLSGSKRLKPHIKKIVSSESTRIFLSPLSIWEATMLGEKDRIEMRPNPRAWLEEALKILPVEDAPFQRNMAFKLSGLLFKHSDPVDKFLAVTAYEMKIPLVTSDKNLLDLDWMPKIDAR